MRQTQVNGVRHPNKCLNVLLDWGKIKGRPLFVSLGQHWDKTSQFIANKLAFAGQLWPPPNEKVNLISPEQFAQVKFPDVGSVLGSSQFSIIHMPSCLQKYCLIRKWSDQPINLALLI